MSDVGFEAVDGGDVRVIPSGERWGFALEAAEAVGGDLAVELRVTGAIDVAHAASATGRE